MASTKPVRNSVKNRPLAARSSLIASSFHRAGCQCAVLDDGGYDRHHRERQWQEYFPAEPHQLVVAIAWNHGLGHGEQEKHEQRLEREPDHAGHPGEWRNRDRRQPATKEEDG